MIGNALFHQSKDDRACVRIRLGDELMIRPDGEVCARLVRPEDEPGEDVFFLRSQGLEVNEASPHVGSFDVVGQTITTMMFPFLPQSASYAIIAEPKKREQNAAGNHAGLKRLIGVLAEWHPCRPQAISQEG